MSMSLRKAAKKMDVSHTSVATQKQLMLEVSRRGILDEYRGRIMAGEKTAKVLADLMPEVADHRRWLQHSRSWRSTTKKLIFEHGANPDEMIGFILALAVDSETQ